ncbi:MAG: esterase-like activity of phytase family protein [Alphaproteobacteria bacterium]|nr:esterase-like activity of phytase family protein [Alphaproteobacteria bacterium]
MSSGAANRVRTSLTPLGYRLAKWLVAFVCLGASPTAGAETIGIDARSFELLPGEVAPRIGQLSFVAGLELTSPDGRFGGLSGLVIEGATNRLIAVSDRGRWFTARLLRSADGRLVGLEQGDLSPMLSLDGRTGVRGLSIDAEALTREPDGSLVVAFEHRHRLWRYAFSADPATAVPVALASPRDLTQAPDNGGIEALVALATGELLAIAEELTDGDGMLVGWLGHPGKWQPIRYRPTGQFRPTDLALLPSGDVLVLERRFSWVGGVAARLARLAAASIRPGAVLEGQEIARLERPLELDNFEGLAVATHPEGGLWLYLVSDDNFNPLQRTLLLQFHLPD